MPSSLEALLRNYLERESKDAGTTLKVYAHVIPQSQRESMERIANRSIGTKVPIGTGTFA